MNLRLLKSDDLQ